MNPMNLFHSSAMLEYIIRDAQMSDENGIRLLDAV